MSLYTCYNGSTTGLLIFFMARTAVACPVCYAANPKGLIAYYGTTLLLASLPLLMLGGVGWWIYRVMGKR